MKKLLFLLSISIMLFSCMSSGNLIVTEEPARPSGQTDVVDLAVAPIDTVRVAFIGLGGRGRGAVYRYTHIEGVKIVALCDVFPEKVEMAQKYLEKAGLPKAASYSGNEEAWKQMCERDDIDLVYICTDWYTHVPMSLYAMENGKHVACEVPMAITLDECWALVDMAEKKQLHCMMLENCCYDFYEMAVLNMAQQGVFGEIVHVEGAYIHDLSWGLMASRKNNEENEHWRMKFNRLHDGNPYPTHGLGPVAQVLNIGRGDKMDYLVSLSCNQVGFTEHAKTQFGEDAEQAKLSYKKGDMNNTLIKTAKGRSILIQHDITSPRPYNRKYAVSGTKGYAEKYPVKGIAIGDNAHVFQSKEQFDSLMVKYEHPITKDVGEIARKVGGHGGMDFIMDYRLIYCLRNGLPLDMNVYDAAEWSSLVELSEISVENNSAPVKIPDFTRGAWNKIDGYRHAMAK